MDELKARIEALERAVTDGNSDLSELATAAETGDRLTAVETELEDLADRVAELEAATQALRGYVGNVRAVNREVEQRADAALAKAESVESAIVGGDTEGRPGHGRSDNRRETATRSGRPSGGDTNGRPPGSHDTPAAPGQPDRAEANTGRTADTDQRAATESAGADSHGRCVACGRPTEQSGGHGVAGANGAAAERANGDNTAVGETGDNNTTTGGVGADGAVTGGQEGVTAGGLGVDRATGQPGGGEAHDPLEGVFEADEPESRDEGAFDRIREML
jgi:hypothetical protein